MGARKPPCVPSHAGLGRGNRYVGLEPRTIVQCTGAGRCAGEGTRTAGASVLALVAWLCLRHRLSGIPAAARGRGVLYECPGEGAPEERARYCLCEPAT